MGRLEYWKKMHATYAVALLSQTREAQRTEISQMLQYLDEGIYKHKHDAQVF